VTEVGGFKKYVRVCTTARCNNWDGISPNGGGSRGFGGRAVVTAVMILALISA